MSRISAFMSSPSRSPVRGLSDVDELPDLNSNLSTASTINSSRLLSQLSNDLELDQNYSSQLSSRNVGTVSSTRSNARVPTRRSVFQNSDQLERGKLINLRGSVSEDVTGNESTISSVRSARSNNTLPSSNSSNSSNSSSVNKRSTRRIQKKDRNLSTRDRIAQSRKSSDIEISSPEGFVENEDLLRKLTDLDFIPINNIMVTDRKGNSVAKYIKVFDSRGNISYLDIDVDGNVMRTPGDISTNLGISATSVPLSVKMGLYECANMDACGVAMECENGICMLMHNNISDEDKMKEIMLSKETNNGEDVMIATEATESADAVVGYPIIKLSEVLENPILSAKIVDSTTVRIQRNAINKYLFELNELDKSTQNSINNTKLFTDKLSNKILRVKENLISLDKVRSYFDLNIPQNEEQSKNKIQNAYLIREHNEIFNNLITLSKNVRRYQKIYNDISNDAQDFNKLIDEVVANAQDKFNK